MSSDAVVKRRQAARECLDLQAIADRGQTSGRLDTPIIKGPTPLPKSVPFDLMGCCLQQLQMMHVAYEQQESILRELQRQSDYTVETAIRKLMIPTIDVVSFLLPSSVLSVAPGVSAGAFVTVSQVVVSEGYDGILEKVGLGAFPSTALDALTWTIRISGDAAPKFSSLKFTENSLSTPLDFKMYVPPGRTILLQVRNDSAFAVSLAGIMSGYFRPARGIGGA